MMHQLTYWDRLLHSKHVLRISFVQRRTQTAFRIGPLWPFFPDLVTWYCIFLTLRVTVATNERSISKLKLIKSYLRSTMAQDRLSNLGIPSIENERFSEISRHTILESFAKAKVRKKGIFLLFKHQLCLSTVTGSMYQQCQSLKLNMCRVSVWTVNVVLWVLFL